MKCDREFEKLVLGSKAADKIACPACGSNEVEKMFSSFYGRSRGGDGNTRSLSSGCSSCSAGSCAGCKSS
jgi:putative FmdB family regulatory protein